MNNETLTLFVIAIHDTQAKVTAKAMGSKGHLHTGCQVVHEV